MFYSQFILAKKGPLGTIWIAAHLERKLRKNQVADTDIGFSVDSILFPEMPIALRLSSHLLLGVVRIYSRKVNYLFDDCSEALLKVKQAFRSTAVDLPPEESTAPYHSITLPETFDLDDFELPDSEIFHGNYVDHHISSKEQITLQDTMEGVVYSTSNFGLDERFGDGDACGLDLDEELLVEKAATVGHATGTSNSDVDPQASDQVNALFKYDHDQDSPTISEALPLPAGGIMNQQIDEYDGDDEPVDYAQAPCTPGLWEEPNLSNIQETSAYDDHQESENHTITEFTVKENLENTSSDQHRNQFEPLEKSPPHISTTEQMSMNDLVSEPVSVDQIKSMSPIAEVPEPVVSVVDKNFSDQEPEVLTVNDNLENYVQNQDISNNITHEVNQDYAVHTTNQLELNMEPSSPQDEAFTQPKDSKIPDQSTHDSMPSFDFMGLRPCVTLSNHDATKQVDTVPIPVPESGFTSLQQHPSAYSVPEVAVVQQETETLESYLPEVGPSNVVQVASSIPNRQADNVIERETQVHNTNLLDHEKVLSFSQGHSDVVTESTPSEIIHPRAFSSTMENVTEREDQVHNSNSYTSDFPAPEHLDVVPESTPVEIVQPRAFPSTIINRQVENVTETEREFQVNNYSSNFPAPEQLLSFSQQVPKNLVVPESTPVILAPSYEGDTGNNMYSGRKRSFTQTSQSHTAHSFNFNLNESSTFYTTNTTMSKESFQDDDLLSSILVGRSSSMLKMKPTPTPTEVLQSTKRRRQSAPKTTPRTGVSKRKVLMDDSMVLHGDTIRDQLTHTEDIRRVRKKAPCTRSEISTIEKQFWEDNLFGEAIFTGMSNKLASLQRELYDISKIVVSLNDASLEHQKSVSQNHEKNDEKDDEKVTENTGVYVSVEPDVPREKEEEDQDKVDLDLDHVAMKDVHEEPSMVTDNHTYDNNNTTDLDYYENQHQPQMHTTGDFTELFGPEHDVLDNATEIMEIDEKSIPDSDNGVSVSVIPVEAESPLTHANVVPTHTNGMSLEPCEVENVASQLLMGPPPGFDSKEKIDLQSVTETDPGPPPGFHSNEKIDIQATADVDPGPPPGFHSNEEIELQSADVDPGPPPGFHLNKEIDLQSIESEVKLDDDNSVREIPEEVQEPVADASTTFSPEASGLRSDIATLTYEDAAYPSTVDCTTQNQVSNAYDSEINQALEDALLDEREKPGHQSTIPVITLNLEDIPADNRVDVNDEDDDGVNDTDFLNFDDVDDDEADDDDGDKAEATKMLDNSGWSSRTRAVARYLQIMFDKEGERGRNMVGVNNLLAGKTRKEASRMFFETLVLKTKDYIHVEQSDPFENINVFPRSKLLKSEF